MAIPLTRDMEEKRSDARCWQALMQCGDGKYSLNQCAASESKPTPSLIFWPLWLMFSFIAIVTGTYGEIGTIAWHYRYAPLIWLIGFIMCVLAGISAAKHYVGTYRIGT